MTLNIIPALIGNMFSESHDDKRTPNLVAQSGTSFRIDYQIYSTFLQRRDFIENETIVEKRAQQLETHCAKTVNYN